MAHGCTDCTHLKRYRSDLLANGVSLGDRVEGVADDPSEPNLQVKPCFLIQIAPSNQVLYQNVPLPQDGEMDLPAQPKQQDSPPANGPRGYVRLAVMDGKTITHKVCFDASLSVLPSFIFSQDLCCIDLPK
jgi:hypothetical protein